jgi:5-methyltetrahydrofolate--homocysteine methyltransferase
VTPLLDRLRAGDVVLADGAWGTVLMARGLEPGAPPEWMTLDRPAVLDEVARAYLDAGAEILTTNTFGGSPLRLEAHGLASEVERVNRRAVEIARRAAGDRAYVAASVGPTGRVLAPYGDTDPAAVEAAFAAQIRALAAEGPDLIVVETMTDLREARLALGAARRVAPNLPVIVTLTFEHTPRGLFTVMGTSVAQAADALGRDGADILGSNCGCGSAAMIEIARAFRQCTDRPIAIQPNAGLPEPRGGRIVYPEDPSFMAAQAAVLLETGVAILGGCCGTTPDHIRALRDVVEAWRRGRGTGDTASAPARGRPARGGGEGV